MLEESLIEWQQHISALGLVVASFSLIESTNSAQDLQVIKVLTSYIKKCRAETVGKSAIAKSRQISQKFHSEIEAIERSRY